MFNVRDFCVFDAELFKVFHGKHRRGFNSYHVAGVVGVNHVLAKIDVSEKTQGLVKLLFVVLL